MPSLGVSRGTAAALEQLESPPSFASGPAVPRPNVRYAWSGNPKIDNDAYHRMEAEYRAAKEKESRNELKIKQLAAQLARTEEAAKRALVRSDQRAPGGMAAQLLAAQRQIAQLQADNSELSSKVARERRRANDYRAAAEEHRRRLEAALREQRSLVRRLGEAERSHSGARAARLAARRAAVEEELWSEEAGRRFAEQQEELVGLREQVTVLQAQLDASLPADAGENYEAAIQELQAQVTLHETRARLHSGVTSANEAGSIISSGAMGSSIDAACGTWLLESFTEGGACYLWERSTGRVFTDAPDGHWPRPVGLKQGATTPMQLGVKGRLDGVFRSLAAASSTAGGMQTADALQKLMIGRGCVAKSCSSCAVPACVDVRDVPALMAILLPGTAQKDIVELTTWMQLEQQVQQQSAQQQDTQLKTQRQQQLQQQDRMQRGAIPLALVEVAAAELLSVHEAVRQARDVTINGALLRIRRAVRQEPQRFAGAWEKAASTTPGGSLGTLQVLEVLRGHSVLPDLAPAEARTLLMLLHQWDVPGTGRCSLAGLLAALQLPRLVRVSLGALPTAMATDEQPGSSMSGSYTTALMAGSAQHGANRQAVHGSAVATRDRTGDAAPSQREAYLAERVAALEAQLMAARAGSPGAGSGRKNGGKDQVEVLRAEVARYQARLSELENDFLSLDVVAHAEVGEYDAEMRKAWFTAAAFKKRYVEHKAELDAVRAAASKMQVALDETHRALQVETSRRMALEDAAAAAKMEASRAKDLATALSTERAERLKLEKEYLDLQTKAFAAPGTALAEVRALREELLSSRREQALSEAREAELRREAAAARRALEGISPEEHRAATRDLADTRTRLKRCELELQAALDKLDVYRRADTGGMRSTSAWVAVHTSGIRSAECVAMSQDAMLEHCEGKSQAELCADLLHLQQAMVLQANELDKMRKLLDTEAAISLEAKAALEEAQALLTAARTDATQQLARLRRELCARDERVQCLEAKLCGKADGTVRSSALQAVGQDSAGTGTNVLRISRAGSTGHGGGAIACMDGRSSLDALLHELAPHENVIELIVKDAELEPSLIPVGAATFVAFDFFMHDSQATPIVPGTTPRYNTTVQYVVEEDSFLLQHLSTAFLNLELFVTHGGEAEAAGVARLPLKEALLSSTGSSMDSSGVAWRTLDIETSTGQHCGRLCVGLRSVKALDITLLKGRGQGTSIAGVKAAATSSLPHAPEAAAGGSTAAAALRAAALQADSRPSTAACLVITIQRCEGLVQCISNSRSGGGSGNGMLRPYAHYLPPGRSVWHDTAVQEGAAPVFDDTSSWGLERSVEAERALAAHTLQVAVFDDAATNATSALLGVAAVPLAELGGSGVPVEGWFELLQPATGLSTGRVCVSIAWAPAPATVLAGARPLQARAPPLPAVAAGSWQVQGRAQDTPAVAGTAALQDAEAHVVDLQQPAGISELMSAAPHQLPTVPLLGQRTAGVHSGAVPAASMPSVSQAAAAAVAAAFSQRPPLPMLPNTLLSSDPTAAFRRPGGGDAVEAWSRPQVLPAEFQHDSGAGNRWVPESSRAYQQPQLQARSQSQSQPQPQPQPAGSTVLQRISCDPAAWPDVACTIVLRVDGLRLSKDALTDPGLQHVLVAHMLLEDHTDAAMQCTHTQPVGPGTLLYDYCVAYRVADPATRMPTPAGVALTTALAAADAGSASHLVLPLLLASNQGPEVTDYAAVECVATCELDLTEIWAGSVNDAQGIELPLLPAPECAARYPSGCAGWLRLTLVASAALATLRSAKH